MKHLKLFQKQTDYQTFVESSNFVTPNVSVTTEENFVFYHPFSNTFNLEFNPTVSGSLYCGDCHTGTWTELRYFERIVNNEISELISNYNEYYTNIFEVIINNITNENTVTNPLMGYCDLRYEDYEFDDSEYKDTVSSYTVKLPFFVWYENNNLMLVVYKYKYSLVIEESDGYFTGEATYISESDEIYVNCVTGPTLPDGSLEPTPWVRYPILTVPPITPEPNYVINLTVSKEEIALAEEDHFHINEEEFYREIETNGLRSCLSDIYYIVGENMTKPFDNVLPCHLVNQMLVDSRVDINITYNLTITQDGSVVKTYTEDTVETFFIYFDESFPDNHGSYWILTERDSTSGLHAKYVDDGTLWSNDWSFGEWC